MESTSSVSDGDPVDMGENIAHLDALLQGAAALLNAARGYISPGNSELAAHAASAPAGIQKVTSCF